MIPGSAIRGTFRSVLSAHWRRAGKNVWAPNGLAEEPKNAKDDPLLPVFGSIGHDSNLLVSDAYPVAGKEARMYVQELHAEDEFTQGPYGSSKFNRPCLVSGTFEFQIAIRESVSGQEGPGLHGKALQEAEQLIEAAKILGQARMLPFGGGIWRGHGWVQFSLAEQGRPDARQPELEAHDNSSAEAV